MRYVYVILLSLMCFVSSAHDEAVFWDGGRAIRAERDALTGSARNFDVVSTKTSSLSLVGRGERRLKDGNTDVWAHKGYAYIGTFDLPCGTGKVGDAGVQIFDVRNPSFSAVVAALPSVKGSRINDIKVASMHRGDILVHSNEPCKNGPGGFEIYDVSDPLQAVHLAHVQTDSINLSLHEDPDHLDQGVHNLFLFSREGKDYVASQVNTSLGAFQIFDISDTHNIRLVSHFGPEQLKWPDTNWVTEDNAEFLKEAITYINSGYGQMTSRLLHDHYITPDGKTAYLANWDAGLIRLDLSDLSKPEVVSVALALDDGDGEVNSHSVWPTADGKIVVEGEEDFEPFATRFSIESGLEQGSYPSSEGRFSTPIESLPESRFSGTVVYVGDACSEMPRAQKAQVALAIRGNCTFLFKSKLAEEHGYAGIVIFNLRENADELVAMGGDGSVGIPSLFVGHATGLKLAGKSKLEDLKSGQVGESFSISTEASGWSGVRIWDYSDPKNPILASSFNTLCSAYPEDESCDPRGTYSSHNIIVEGSKAYISWYSEGLIVLDISNPYEPKELARYHMSGPEFEGGNGGIQDIWGIYKIPGEPWIYASDRHGGLYVLQEKHGVTEQAPLSQ